MAFESADSAVGHEQANERPAVIAGTQFYCQLPNSLALVVPLTSRDRGLVWQPKLSIGTKDRPSIALVEQIRAVSYDRLRHRQREKLTIEDIESLQFVMRQMINVA